ncbi:hypothetical protein BJ165DRAFT_1473415 [Panaeolus papilionaceus]|nr:hypothetical protein BJ165DRAFT_1473415 [Panaeolus papilionaceus]
MKFYYSTIVGFALFICVPGLGLAYPTLNEARADEITKPARCLSFQPIIFKICPINIFDIGIGSGSHIVCTNPGAE